MWSVPCPVIPGMSDMTKPGRDDMQARGVIRGGNRRSHGLTVQYFHTEVVMMKSLRRSRLALVFQHSAQRRLTWARHSPDQVVFAALKVHTRPRCFLRRRLEARVRRGYC
jgi:hypothetical protein